MKSLLGALAIGIIVAAQPAAARPWFGGVAPALQAPDQRMYPRGQEKRGQREMRRDQRMPPDRGGRPPGRLTDEERQDLRRDIDKANREIYRRRQQR